MILDTFSKRNYTDLLKSDLSYSSVSIWIFNSDIKLIYQRLQKYAMFLVMHINALY